MKHSILLVTLYKHVYTYWPIWLAIGAAAVNKVVLAILLTDIEAPHSVH